MDVEWSGIILAVITGLFGGTLCGLSLVTPKKRR